MSRFRRVAAKTAALALNVVPKSYLVEFAGLINKRYAGDQPAADILIDMMLRHSSDVAATINELAAVVSVDDVLFAINRLADSRHAALNALFESASSISNPVVRAVVTLWRAETNGSVMSAPELEHLLSLSREFSGRGKRRLELLLLHAMLRAERLELAEKLLDGASHFSFTDMPSPYRTGILRCVLKSDPGQYGAMRRKIGTGMTALDQLRILELDVAAGYIAEAPDHAALVEQFLRAAPAPVARDFRDKIKPFYDAHDMRLMNARVNKNAAREIVSRITSSISDKRALSLVRLGDGEAYAYATSGTEDDGWRERHWWGCQLHPDLRGRLQSELRNSYEAADILGVPSVHRFIRDTSPLSQELSTGTSSRGLVTVMTEVRPKAGALLVEDRIHQVLFGKETLQAFAAAAGRVIVISSLRPKVVSAAFPNAIGIAIPTHDKLRTNDVFLRGEAPLPHLYTDVVREIRSTVREGDLALVAAGIIGKIFVHEASKRGAVALDVGSMLDYLAGAKTRSVADLV